MSGDPFPKSSQLARGERRYRRKIASPKTWQAIIDAKQGPCRCCGGSEPFWTGFGRAYHHLVSRQDGGDDTADNIIPLCAFCHEQVTRRDPFRCRSLLLRLSDAEYAYMVDRGGEGYAERAYGITYERPA